MHRQTCPCMPSPWVRGQWSKGVLSCGTLRSQMRAGTNPVHAAKASSAVWWVSAGSCGRLDRATCLFVHTWHPSRPPGTRHVGRDSCPRGDASSQTSSRLPCGPSGGWGACRMRPRNRFGVVHPPFHREPRVYQSPQGDAVATMARGHTFGGLKSCPCYH